MKNDVLFLAYDGLTDPLGQAQILPYVAGLNNEERQFHIVSFEKQDKIDKQFIIQNYCDKNSILWHPLKYTKKPPIISTVWDVFNAFRNVKKLHKQYNFKVIHCRSYLAAMVGVKLKKKYGIKIIFDMRGFWPDERLDGKTWNLDLLPYRLVYNYMKKQEKYLLENADEVVCLTEAAKNVILTEIKNDIRPNKIHIIPCCVDFDLFNSGNYDELDIENKRISLGIPNGYKVLSYLGSVGSWYKMDEMLNFYKIFKNKLVETKFLVISTTNKDDIKSLVNKSGIPMEDVIITSGTRNEIPLLLLCAEFSIFFYDQVFSIKGCSPTKFGEILALGIPAITNCGIGDVDALINQFEAGVVVEKFDKVDYENALNVLLNKEFMRDGIRKNAINYYDLKNGLQLYNQIYNKLLTD